MTDNPTGGPASGSWPFGPVGSGAPAEGGGSGWPATSGAGRPDRAPDAAGPEPEGTSPEPGPNRSRRGWIFGGIGAVVVIGVGVAVAMMLGGSDEPGAAATRTTTLAPPTATAVPAAREAGSAFLTALPSTVLQYVWSAVTPDAEWSAAGAVEAYGVVYTDGGTAQMTVRAGQWATPADATAAQAKVVAALTAAAGAPADSAATPPATPAAPAAAAATTGDVVVGGTTVGSWTVVPGAGGTGTIVWSNGTTLFAATGPSAELANIYAAYPL